MATWLDLASENRAAALALFSDAMYRSMINRAYFAVYAKATHALSIIPVSMPQGREGPTHRKLRPMVEANLTTMRVEKRQALSQMIGELYYMRLRADYVPSDAIDMKDARSVLTLMEEALSLV